MGLGIVLHSIFTSVLGEGELLLYSPGRFTYWERAVGTQEMGGWWIPETFWTFRGKK
jgi:hypothetical protein